MPFRDILLSLISNNIFLVLMLKSLLPRTTNLQKTSRKEFPSFSTLLNFPLYEFYLLSLPILTYLGNFYAKMEDPKNLKQKISILHSLSSIIMAMLLIDSPDPLHHKDLFQTLKNVK